MNLKMLKGFPLKQMTKSRIHSLFILLLRTLSVEKNGRQLIDRQYNFPVLYKYHTLMEAYFGFPEVNKSPQTNLKSTTFEHLSSRLNMTGAMRDPRKNLI